jgi:prevent-host-death family protein
MVKTLSAWDARRQFGKVLRDVSRDGEPVIVESHGEPVVAMVPVQVFEAMMQQRQNFYDHARSVAERVDLSEDEAQEIISSAIERVRRQP